MFLHFRFDIGECSQRGMMLAATAPGIQFVNFKIPSLIAHRAALLPSVNHNPAPTLPPSRESSDSTLARWNRYRVGIMTNRTPTVVALSALAAIAVMLVWFGAYGPIWKAAWSAQPSDWLGFAGNVLAGAMTLCAAGVAWLAVRMQVRNDQDVASRGHQLGMSAIKQSLRPLLECLDVLRTVFDETLSFVGTEEEKLSRTTWLQSFHYTLPPPTITNDIRENAASIDRDRVAALENVLLRIANFYRLTTKYSEQTERADELNWRMHDIQLMRLQIALLQDAVEKFEPSWVEYFGEHSKIELDDTDYADALRGQNALWKEEEVRRRAEGFYL